VPAAFARLRDGFGRRQQRVDELRFRLDAAWRASLRHRLERWNTAAARLVRQDATHRLAAIREGLAGLESRLLRAQQASLIHARASHANAAARLNSLSPLAVLNRGYALVFDQAGHLIKDAGQAREGQAVTTRLARGSFKSRIFEIEPGKKAEP
jgi:exodeoxyribonuclease VII large subunit